MAFTDSLFQFCLDSMRDNPVLLLFILLGSGYLIGNLRIAGFSLGSVAGVLFAPRLWDLRSSFFLSATRRGRASSVPSGRTDSVILRSPSL